ncbi:MAG: HD domain-containing phosphohydrolase [Spirochaetota bacterium]
MTKGSSEVENTPPKGAGENFSLPLPVIPVPALVVDLQTFVIVDANSEALTFYGYPQAELLGMQLQQLYTEGDLQQGPQGGQEVIANLSGVTRHRLSDGRVITVRVACAATTYRNRPACILFPMNLGAFAPVKPADSAREKAILNALPDLVFEVDLQGRIYSFHAGHKEMLLVPEGELIGKLVQEIVPESLLQTTMLALQEAQEKGIATGHQYELKMPGREQPNFFEYSVARVDSEESPEPRFIVVSRDITARKNAESELRKSQNIIKSTLDNLPIGIAINSVKPIVNFRYMNDNFARFYATDKDKLREPDSFWQAVYEDSNFRRTMRERVIADTMSGDPERMVWHEVPIQRTGQATRYITARNILLPDQDMVVSMVWDVTEARQAREALEANLRELEKAMLSTVEVATTISAMRDPYTAGHAGRVAAIAEALAVHLGLETKQVQGIRVGAHLHDVGKVVVPAEILSKPGRLTAAEMQIIRSHAEAGYDVLKGVNFPWPVAEIARSHHERLDGSGYPRGLKGDEIIIEARIVAVADVVEAMASHRPYRPGLGIEKALGEIQRGSGTWYDPDVVNTCLALFRSAGFTLPEN